MLLLSSKLYIFYLTLYSNRNIRDFKSPFVWYKWYLIWILILICKLVCPTHTPNPQPETIRNIQYFHQSNSSELNNLNESFTRNHNENIIKLYSNRRLNSSASVSVDNTIVSQIQDIYINESQTITVTPRDSNGSNLGEGCFIFVQLSNRCIFNDTVNSCEVDTDAENITDTSIKRMEFNETSESYNFTYTINKLGPISIYIYLLESRFVHTLTYTNDYF